jgi:uncharacterized protein (DUF4213/DUF364 family)
MEEKNMILERIYEMAKPRLSGKKIKEVRIGLALMAVELDDGSIGVTYVLRNEIDDVCTAIPNGGKLEGAPAEEVALWAFKSQNVVAAALGVAVLNAVAEFDKIGTAKDSDDQDAIFSVKIQSSDTIGVVGHIGPVINRLRGKVKRIIIFERGEDTAASVYPESAQPELLPDCQVVFVTSSTLINGTLEALLTHCTQARDIVMVGSSTPLYPEAFQNTGVSVLAGTRWNPENKAAIFAGISQCSGMKQLIKQGEKYSVQIKRH